MLAFRINRRKNEAVPGFLSFFLPLLKLHSDGETHSSLDSYSAMAEHFEMSEDGL
jgi:hypothetical protein